MRNWRRRLTVLVRSPRIDLETNLIRDSRFWLASILQKIGQYMEGEDVIIELIFFCRKVLTESNISLMSCRVVSYTVAMFILFLFGVMFIIIF